MYSKEQKEKSMKEKKVIDYTRTYRRIEIDKRVRTFSWTI